jgi:hypothetical protein
MPEQIARRFVRGRVVTVEPLMKSLAALGQAERGEDGRFADQILASDGIICGINY